MSSCSRLHVMRPSGRFVASTVWGEGQVAVARGITGCCPGFVLSAGVVRRAGCVVCTTGGLGAIVGWPLGVVSASPSKFETAYQAVLDFGATWLYIPTRRLDR
jgi:hypothetical protein